MDNINNNNNSSSDGRHGHDISSMIIMKERPERVWFVGYHSCPEHYNLRFFIYLFLFVLFIKIIFEKYEFFYFYFF